MHYLERLLLHPRVLLTAIHGALFTAWKGFSLTVDGRCKLSQHLLELRVMNFSYKQGNLRPGLVVLLNIQAGNLQGRHSMQLWSYDWHHG